MRHFHTLSSNQQQEPFHESIEEEDFDSIVDEYISDEEKKEDKSLSLENRMKFERPKHNFFL
jgi:hypothetical protein